MCWDAQISRRQFLKGVAGAGALAVSGNLMAKEVFAAAEPIKISAPHPMTGPVAGFGRHSLWGLELAAKRINAAGGIAGRPVELLVEDDAGKPADAVRLMRKHILRDKADFIIGGVSSAETIPMCPVAEELETLFMVTVAESPIVTSEKCNKYTFRLTPDARQKAKAMAPFMVKELGIKKWQIIYWDMAWGEGMRDEFNNQLKKLGGEIVNAIPSPIGTTDFAPYLAKLQPADKAPGVIHSVAGLDSVRLDKAIGEFGLQKKYKLVGHCCTMFADVFDEIAPAIDGVFIIDQYPDLRIPPTDTAWDMQFHKEFLEISKTIPPESHSWSSFESLYVVKKAVEEVGYKSKKDTMKIIEAIEGQVGGKSPDFPQGPYYNRPEDHQGLLDLYIVQIKDGKEHMIKVVTARETEVPPSPQCKM
jgi:branched-chain amino acid transport system substrate-binding protein